MKKNAAIISLVLITLSLTAFGLLNRENSEPIEFDTINYEYPIGEVIDNKDKPNIFFGIGSRFNGITKSDLNKLETFDDYIGQDHASRIISYKSMSVILLDDTERTNERIPCQSGTFSSEQKNFLNNLEYSTNFMIWADYVEKSEDNGVIQDATWTPHLTIIPEKQAMYKDGDEALLDILKSKSYDLTTTLDQDGLQPAKMYFTISKDGKVIGTDLKRSSGYNELDELMKTLIMNLPSGWQAAENNSGEKIEQTLVLSYGKLGC